MIGSMIQLWNRLKRAPIYDERQWNQACGVFGDSLIALVICIFIDTGLAGESQFLSQG